MLEKERPSRAAGRSMADGRIRRASAEGAPALEVARGGATSLEPWMVRSVPSYNCRLNRRALRH